MRRGRRASALRPGSGGSLWEDDPADHAAQGSGVERGGGAKWGSAAESSPQLDTCFLIPSPMQGAALLQGKENTSQPPSGTWAKISI